MRFLNANAGTGIGSMNRGGTDMTEVPVHERKYPKLTVQLKFVDLHTTRPKLRRVKRPGP